MAEENASDQIADAFVTHTINLLRFSADQQNQALDALTKLENELVKDLANTVGKTPSKVAQLQALLKQTQATINTAYQGIADQQAATLGKLAHLEATKAVNVVNKAIQAPIATVGMSPEQLQAIAGKSLVNGKHPSEWWKNQSQQLQDAFAAQMRMGMMKGEGIDQLAKRVRGTKALHYTDGLMVAKKHQAVALVRTSVLTVANEAKLKTFEKNAKLIKGVQWVATLDSRTTDICMALNGKQWTFPGFEPVGHNKVWPGPIAHWQCRSTQISVLHSWKDLAGPKSKLKDKAGKPQDLEAMMKAKLKEKGMSDEQIAKVTLNTKASMDGQVAADLTFDDWLSKKPADFQDRMLGPGRAKLWREGKATLSQMTDQNNRPLTLGQLEALVAQDVDLPPAKWPGQDGLELVERKALEDAMAMGQNQQTLHTFVDMADGSAHAIQGDIPSLDDVAKIKAMKDPVAASNGLTPGSAWTPEQLKLYSTLPKLKKAHLVDPDGTVQTLEVMRGETFIPSDAEALVDAYKAKLKDKPTPAAALKSANREVGTSLQFSTSKPGVIQPAKKPQLTEFPPIAEKPAPYFDPAREAAKKQAQATAQAAAEAKQAAADLARQKAAQQAAETSALRQKLQQEAAAARAQAKAAAAAKAAQEAAEKAAKAAAQKIQDEAQAKIGQTLATSPKGPLGVQLTKLMQSNPGLQPTDLLDQANQAVQAAKTKAVVNQNVAGYKKAMIAGKVPTKKQLDVVNALSVDEQNAIIAAIQKAQADAWAAEQAAAAAAAAQAAQDAAAAQAKAQAITASIPDAPPIGSVDLPEPQGFPDDPMTLRVLPIQLGGSTGAELVEDAQGNRYVRKRGANQGHVREEIASDYLYRAMGANVPEAKLYETPNGPVKLARFVPDAKSLGTALASATPAQRKALLAEAQRHFGADALMGNWDVAGAGMDNMLVDATGKVWRIDNGGSLRYRAQGGLKTPDQWNEYATELWTMRGLQINQQDKGVPISAQTREVFGTLDIYQIARQIRAIPDDALKYAPADQIPLLEARLANMKAIANKALDYEVDGTEWKADAIDKVTRHMMHIRQAGVLEQMPKAAVHDASSSFDQVFHDENGEAFDHLRTKSNNPSTAQLAAKKDQDPWLDPFVAAQKTWGYNGKNGAPPNQAKMQAAQQALKDLKAKAAAGDAKATAALAHYGAPMDSLMKDWTHLENGAAWKPQPMMAPWTPPANLANPAAATPPPRNDQSLISQLEAYIKAEGGSPGARQEWQSHQAGHSWKPMARAYKYWLHLQSNRPVTSAYASDYWGTGGLAEAKKNYDILAAKHGGAAALDATFLPYMAFVQEFLGKTEFKYNDKGRRVVRLMRTEDSDIFPAYAKQKGTPSEGIAFGKYGDFAIPKGLNESHSIWRPVTVHGDSMTIMAVPHTRITSLYWMEQIGGSGQTGFLGDGENEFTANSSHLPFSHVPMTDKRINGLPPDAWDDATKWGVPLHHLKNP